MLCHFETHDHEHSLIHRVPVLLLFACLWL